MSSDVEEKELGPVHEKFRFNPVVTKSILPSFNPKQLISLEVPNKVIAEGSVIEINSNIGPQLFASVIVAV